MTKQLVTRPAIGAALILMIPLVMTYLDRAKPAGDGFHWSPMDFVVMGALLFGAGLAYEFLARKVKTPNQRWALGLGILAVVILIWIELAVNAVSQLIAYLFA